jgi:hypothetical protein
LSLSIGAIFAAYKARLNAKEAERQRITAESSAKEARRQKDIALRNELEAKRQEGIAEEETVVAQRNSRESKARELAVYATESLSEDQKKAFSWLCMQ